MLSVIINLILIAVIIICSVIKRFRRIGFAFLFFFLSNIGLFVIGKMLSVNKTRHMQWSLTETLVFLLVFSVTVAFTYWLARKIDVIPPFNFKYFRVGKMFAAIGIIYGSGVIINLLQMIITRSPTVTVPANQAGINDMANSVPYLLLAIPIVFAGFFEELTYRVGIFELLFPKHKKLAFVISAFIFAFLHVSAGSLLDWHAWLLYGAMSFVLTGLYYKWHNFYLNMSVHATYNFIGVVLNGLLSLLPH